MKDDIKEWGAVIWRVFNEIVLYGCWIAFCAVVIVLAIASVTYPAKADEKYEEKLYLMQPDYAVIITNQPCKIKAVKDTLGLFVYGRRTDQDKKVTYTGGCYTEKGDSVIILWEKGHVIFSIPTRNFRETVGV